MTVEWVRYLDVTPDRLLELKRRLEWIERCWPAPKVSCHG